MDGWVVVVGGWGWGGVGGRGVGWGWWWGGGGSGEWGMGGRGVEWVHWGCGWVNIVEAAAAAGLCFRPSSAVGVVPGSGGEVPTCGLRPNRLCP